MQLIPTQGMVVAQRVDRADPWHMRVAIALACDRLVPSFPATQVESFFTFLIQNEVLGICRRTYSGRCYKPA